MIISDGYNGTPSGAEKIVVKTKTEKRIGMFSCRSECHFKISKYQSAKGATFTLRCRRVKNAANLYYNLASKGWFYDNTQIQKD